jgi:glycosyltransferase involved in cell wall biosynthesis
MSDTDQFEISDAAVLATNPLVSVCMVTYRHAGFIGQAIESVLAQRCDFPIELVIGDDCSPDRTGEIVLEYQNRRPDLIRVIGSAANVGAYANEDRCTRACRGTYIAVCEGDDYWCDVDKLQQQVAVFRQLPDCQLVFHAALEVDPAGRRIGRTGRRGLFSRTMLAQEVLLGDGGFIPTSSMMYPRELSLDRPRWWVQAPVGDYPLALRATLRGTVAYIDKTMSAYRTNVPHSWTLRHAPDLHKRIRHAEGIEAMLRGYAAEAPAVMLPLAARMISKYYSDPLVRLPGDIAVKRALFSQTRGKMLFSDRLLARLASRWGLRVAWAKDLLRKTRSLGRMAMAHLRCTRLYPSS